MEPGTLTTSTDWVVHNAPPGQIERIEAWFAGHGYAPHRHDTYSIGRTLSGVQSFHYKGTLRHGMPGDIDRRNGLNTKLL
jgi:hypothetical protein